MPSNQEQIFKKLVRQEELILDVTDSLTIALQQAGVSKTALANRIGCSKGLVSQMFGGGRNFTLRTISDIAHALSLRPSLKFYPEYEQRMQNEIQILSWVKPPDSLGIIPRIHSQEQEPEYELELENGLAMAS